MEDKENTGENCSNTPENNNIEQEKNFGKQNGENAQNEHNDSQEKNIVKDLDMQNGENAQNDNDNKDINIEIEKTLNLHNGETEQNVQNNIEGNNEQEKDLNTHNNENGEKEQNEEQETDPIEIEKQKKMESLKNEIKNYVELRNKFKQNLKDSDDFYILNKDWLKQWKKYTNYSYSKRGWNNIDYDEDNNPGKINNNELIFDSSKILKLKDENYLVIKQNKKNDLKLINEEIFNFFKNIYDGGPKIQLHAQKRGWGRYELDLII